MIFGGHSFWSAFLYISSQWDLKFSSMPNTVPKLLFHLTFSIKVLLTENSENRSLIARVRE